ncbi:DUF2778 domain-containing protein [Methylobacterium sp. J-068]|uniref:DUF2778 domain-containing protein n=1 Tax=Methylobacterium sp. J-068 TaxID=2836649 RepID=UPI001FBAD6A5|nr:DUF2778 domain-containing protein [Methylobacterium sp. J-068]MCJ2034082.1 DUF2778 domain-containing protein [Methylobacterium sp. J-068]
MNHALFPSGRRTRRTSRPHGRVLLQTSAVALLCALFPRLTAHDGSIPDAQAVSATARAAAPGPHAWMLDPRPVLGAGAESLLKGAPRTAALVPPTPPSAMALAVPRVPARIAQATPVRTAEATQMRIAQAAPQTIPLPVPRPAGLVARAESPRLALRAAPALRSLAARRTQTARANDAEAERSFFDTVFGARAEPEPDVPAPRTTLAYAAVDPGLDAGPRRALESNPGVSAGTAVYDITARTVTLPSGERLEAHSGLGESMDNPRHVHRRMRGSTPPGTYDLTEREALFHGVRAIRLNPVGGSAAIHGRDGILAHTYMLGPSGASNGCVSFRDYSRFLQAFLRGEVRRLVVVGGRGDAGPTFAERLFGRATR